MTGRDIPNTDNVARYCNPCTIDEHNMPRVTAFTFRNDEESLSVNWLEFLVKSNVSEAVNMVRKLLPNTGYTIRKNGRIAVLGVGDIKIAVSKVTCAPQIKHDPKPKNCSHASIYIETNRYTVAQILARQIRRNPENVYPAIV